MASSKSVAKTTIKQHFSKDTKEMEKEKQMSKTKSSSQPAAKRTHSELSNSSLEESTLILEQLEEIKSEMVTEAKLRSIVNELLLQHKKEVDKKLSEQNEKLKEQNEKLKVCEQTIEGLKVENETLKVKIECKTVAYNSLKQVYTQTKGLAQAAFQKANYNEQYSGKNNIKIHGVKKEKGEVTIDVARQTLSTIGKVTVNEDDIVAVHRIPTKEGQTKPILLKVKNAEIKTKIMQQRQTFKKKGEGVRISDDVTRANSKLIQELSVHAKLENAWYYNGSVNARIQDSGKRIKLDLFDDVDEAILKSKNEEQ